MAYASDASAQLVKLKSLLNMRHGIVSYGRSRRSRQGLVAKTDLESEWHARGSGHNRPSRQSSASRGLGTDGPRQ
jgi:hypothetical protein